MKPAEIASLVRSKTRTNATTFTDAQILTFMNPIMDSMSEEIAKMNENLLGITRQASLVADQRNYAIAEDVISLKYVNAKINGTDWTELDHIDISALGIPLQESNIRSHFTGHASAYDLLNREIYLFSSEAIIDVTNGLEYYAIIYPEHPANLTGTDDLSKDSSSTTRGFPRQFHTLLCTRIIIEYKQSRDKPIPLVGNETTFDKDFKSKLSAIRNLNTQNSFIASLPPETGEDY